MFKTTATLSILMNSAILYMSALCILLLSPVQGLCAAALAEDHTVLYYLIEQHRQNVRSCNGKEMPESPRLMPSDLLRKVAAESIGAGQPINEFANSHGLAGAKFLGTTVNGAVPVQAFDRIKAEMCEAIMSPDYKYIGASFNGNAWVLLMSSSEPGSREPEMDEVVVPNADPASAKSLVSSTASGSDLNREPAPQTTPSQPPPLVTAPEFKTTMPVQANSTGAETGQAAIPGLQAAGPMNPVSDPNAPAKPVVIGHVVTDGAGRPISGLIRTREESPAPGLYPTQPGSYGTSSSAPGPSALQGGQVQNTYTQPIQDTGVAAGYDRKDPNAPAAPRVTAKFVTGPTGEIIGSADPVPGQTGRPGESAPVNIAPVAEPVVGQTAGTSISSSAPGVYNPSEPEQMIISQVNQIRQSGFTCGSTPMPAVSSLRMNMTLGAEARRHAADMAAGNYFSSTDKQGRSLGARLSAAGYVWNFAAENIANMAASPDSVIKSWLADEGQCFNIMDPSISEAGTGFDAGSNIWVLTLATPQ